MKINKQYQNNEEDKESTNYYYESNEQNNLGDINTEISSKHLEPQDNIKKSSRRHFLKPENRLSSNFEGNIENFFPKIEKKGNKKNNLNESNESKSLTEKRSSVP